MSVMTVAKAVATLQQMPQDALLIFNDAEWDYFVVEEFIVKNVLKEKVSGGRFCIRRESDRRLIIGPCEEIKVVLAHSSDVVYKEESNGTEDHTDC